MDWISLFDRLPPDGERVLVVAEGMMPPYSPAPIVMIAYHSEGVWVIEVPDEENWPSGCVKKWMPLPSI